MAEMTPERSRKVGRRWLIVGAAVLAVNMLTGMFGFDAVELPLRVASLLCFMFCALRAGWSDGFRAAERKFAHAVRCDEVCEFELFGIGDHDHRCVLPALDCDPERGRPEHKCHCGMSWIVGDKEAADADT